MHWKPGDVVVKRIVWHDRIWAAWPDLVVEDNDERVVLYTAAGSPWMAPRHPEDIDAWPGIGHMAGKTWQLTPLSWGDQTLIVMPPNAWWELVVWFRGDQFHSYKVNLQTPFTRTALGFDTRDLFLDVEVLPNREWRWLDEDELAEALSLGLVTKDEAEQIRAEGERVIELAERNASPFCDGWNTWKPDSSWPEPVFPDGWDIVAEASRSVGSASD